MQYVGSKSLDAEIYIDFEKGTVLMDYGLNKNFNPLQSNRSTSHDETNEWIKLSAPKKLFHIYQRFTVFFTDPLLGIGMYFITELSLRGWFPKSWQYPYQKFLQGYHSFFTGYYEENFGGEMGGTILQVPVDHNVWCHYDLTGDYEKYITKIAFERRVRKFLKFGKFSQFVQDGWVLTFEFSQPPKEGTVKVQYN
jgi:hypothetical protein